MRELVEAIREASGLPVGLYCQGAGGTALAAAIEAARAGADLIAAAVYPVALVLHRASGEALAERARRPRPRDRRRHRRALARLRPRRRAHQRPAGRAARARGSRPAPREHSLPPGLVAALDLHLRAHSAGDRLDEVIDELERIRAEAGWPPLAAPIGQVLASQALLHVLAAERYQTVVDELRDLLAGPLRRRRRARSRRRPSGRSSSSPTARRPTRRRPTSTSSASATPGSPRARRSSSCSRSSATTPSRSCARSAAAGARSRSRAAASTRRRAERIREIVRIVQDSGVGEVTIEDAGLRVTVRRTPEPAEGVGRGALRRSVEEEETTAAAPAAPPVDPGVIRVEAPMVGTFYRAPSPGAAAVRRGGRRRRGRARRSASSRR